MIGAQLVPPRGGVGQVCALLTAGHSPALLYGGMDRSSFAVERPVTLVTHANRSRDFVDLEHRITAHGRADLDRVGAGRQGREHRCILAA